jgi:hypothetical protein
VKKRRLETLKPVPHLSVILRTFDRKLRPPEPLSATPDSRVRRVLI